MKDFTIVIEELLRKEVTVEANSMEEAFDLVEKNIKLVKLYLLM